MATGHHLADAGRAPWTGPSATPCRRAGHADRPPLSQRDRADRARRSGGLGRHQRRCTPRPARSRSSPRRRPGVADGSRPVLAPHTGPAHVLAATRSRDAGDVEFTSRTSARVTYCTHFPCPTLLRHCIHDYRLRRPTARLAKPGPGAVAAVEAARIGATGWQITRTGARVVTKLTGRGSLQEKILKQIPRRSADLGPTYVKFGQIIASSPGAFGEPMRREFRSLLDAVPPADTDEVPQLFNEELGDDPANLFKHVRGRRRSRRRSIAQVHYATLHSGEEVVVKIQRPGIPPPRRGRSADPQARRAARSSWPSSDSACPPRTWSPTSPTTSPRNSTSGSRRSRWTPGWRTCTPPRWARTSGWPQVYWDLTSERVLTMERHPGHPRIDDVAAIRKKGFDGTELVKALLFSVFEGGLRHGLFHGDLHAGNLYVDDDGKIVFFDFGIMGRIDPRTRVALRELVHALLVEEGPRRRGQDRRADGRGRHREARGTGREDLEKFATLADHVVARRS